MRYAIGEVVPVVSFTVRFKQSNARADVVFFIPWMDELVETSLVFLEIQEHHKVYHSYEARKGKPACDGFKARDGEGRIWLNQLPVARYGQLDDSSDRIFYLEGGPYRAHTDLFSYLENVLRGVVQVEKEELTASDIQMADTDPHWAAQVDELHALKAKQVSLLQAHYTFLKEKYEAETGRSLLVTNTVMKFTDGRPPVVLEDFFTITSEAGVAKPVGCVP